MTGKQAIRKLIRTLTSHKDLSQADVDVIDEATAVLESTAEADSLHLDPVTSLCVNCGFPAFAHKPGGDCPTEYDVQRMAAKLARWERAVQPAREQYERTVLAEHQVRVKIKRGQVAEADLDLANLLADTAWGNYQSAIRRANREAGR